MAEIESNSLDEQHEGIPFVYLLDTTGALDDVHEGIAVAGADLVEAFSEATNPMPSDMLTDVDVNQDLSWTGHGEPDSYDLYFDTADPPTNLEATGLTSPTYDPGELDPGETYYWKVVSKKSGESDATSDVWSFTTAEATTRKARMVIVVT